MAEHGAPAAASGPAGAMYDAGGDDAAASRRQDHALHFLTGKAAVPSNISTADQDIAAWLLMNSDLFPNSHRPAPPGLAPGTGAGHGHAGAAGGLAAGAMSPAVATMAKSLPSPAPPVPPPTVPAATPAVTATKAAPRRAETAEEKRKRRLLKNREIARNCRKRKRAKMLDMEDQLRQLTEANRRLRLRVQQGHDVQKKEDKRVQMLNQIQSMIQANAPERDIAEKINAYKDLFSDYGKDRQAAVNYHLEQLRMLLLPTQVTKMCMWSLHQDDEFYETKTPATTQSSNWGGGIWAILCKELNITESQKRDLLRLRTGIKAQRQRLRTSLRMLTDLEGHVKAGVDSLGSEMLQLMKCVTPNQQARFLLWIERNQACMHMLNNLWKTEPAETAPRTAGTSPTTSVASSAVSVAGSASPMSSAGEGSDEVSM